MTGAVHQLIYCSRNVTGEAGASQGAELAAILASARRNNKRAGVTGALLFTPTEFAQVLEGPCNAVETIFERIQTDMRHTDVTVLSFLPAGRRSFPAWSMAAAGGADPAAPQPLEAALNDCPRAAAATVLRLLERMVRGQEDQAGA